MYRGSGKAGHGLYWYRTGLSISCYQVADHIAPAKPYTDHHLILPRTTEPLRSDKDYGARFTFIFIQKTRWFCWRHPVCMYVSMHRKSILLILCRSFLVSINVLLASWPLVLELSIRDCLRGVLSIHSDRRFFIARIHLAATVSQKKLIESSKSYFMVNQPDTIKCRFQGRLHRSATMSKRSEGIPIIGPPHVAGLSVINNGIQLSILYALKISENGS